MEESVNIEVTLKLIDDLKPGECFLIRYNNENGEKETNAFIVVDLGPVLTESMQLAYPNKIYVVDMRTGQLSAMGTGFEVAVMN